MKRLRIALVLVLALPLVAAASPAPTATSTSTAALTVHIKNFAFPKDLVVKPGTTIVFINDDDEPHTVTARDNTFDSKGLDTNDKYTRTFTETGVIKYFCTIHPYMQGVIEVKK
jgi:plastocyanin